MIHTKDFRPDHHARLERKLERRRIATTRRRIDQREAAQAIMQGITDYYALKGSN